MELIDIPGIGEVRKKSLENSDIFSVQDLINYFPYKYYDFTKTEPFLNDGNVRLIKAKVVESAKVVKVRAGLSFTTCKMSDEIGNIFNAVWYNQTYIKSTLGIDDEFYLYGKNSPTKKNTFVVMICKSKDKQKLGYLPVYHTVSGIGQKTLSDSIEYVLKHLKINSLISTDLEKRYNLLTLNDSYKEIHFPVSEEMSEKAFDRVELENLVPLIAINEFNKNLFKKIKPQAYKYTIKFKDEYEKLLPFKLTIAQNNAIYDIEKDLNSKFSMNRLLQGDVGSGKTAVAFYGSYVCVKNGYQSAVIAPTEILANQHFEFAKKIFENSGIKIALITGSISGLERRVLLDNIRNGEISIVVGTHSVFSQDVEFKNLSYIVVDEQHRFGVEQRTKLREKGDYPDILVMSATPIPRSMALVVYGDLELTTLNSRPKPQKIQTNIVSKNKISDMWNYIDNKTKSGSKIYVICSKIDEENENESLKMYSAKNMYDFLCEKFDKNNVGLIHGKMSKDKQNKVISDFKTGKINILVSTTIVEIGVDIPDADIMVIASPERFGLATLHQLRGRIGRDGSEAYCFCLAENLNEKSYERILFFKNHSNGFEIADFDLNQRGSGSVLGTNQHGSDNGLFKRFTSTLYGTAKEILEKSKKDINLYTEILARGNELYNKNILGKIILN